MAEQHELTVLYVEDDEGMRTNMAKALMRHFTNVITASDGKEGLDRFAESKPDIVVTDIQMPAMDGLTMCEVIRAKDPAVPIIVTTAHNNPLNAVGLDRIGINASIQKPLQSKELIDAIMVCCSIESKS